MDSLFKVNLLAQTPQPQELMYWAMHQCYAEEFVSEQNPDKYLTYDESRYGGLCVKHLLKGNRGHYNPLEGPQISFNVGYFPHSVMQQLRTHRTGVSFSVQSFRYSGKRISELGLLGEQYISSSDFEFSGKIIESIEKVFYIRPENSYTDRQGKKYDVTEEQRQNDLSYCLQCAIRYKEDINIRGYSEEHARSKIAFDVRQHFVMSCNLRSLLHIMDLRSKKDAQLECQQFCELVVPHLESWVPEIWEWYRENRYTKARLSP